MYHKLHIVLITDDSKLYTSKIALPFVSKHYEPSCKTACTFSGIYVKFWHQVTHIKFRLYWDTHVYYLTTYILVL